MWKTLCSEPSSPASLAAASLGCPPVCFCLHPATNDSRLTNAAAAPPPPPPPPPLIPVCCLPSTLLHITGFSKMASLDLFGASSKQHLSLGSTSSNENTFLPAAYGGDLTNKKVKNYTSDCLEHSWRFGITLIRVWDTSKANVSQCKSSKSAQPIFFSNTNKGLYSKHLFHTSPVLHKPRFTSSDADEVRCNLTDKKRDVAIIRTEYESQWAL